VDSDVCCSGNKKYFSFTRENCGIYSQCLNYHRDRFGYDFKDSKKKLLEDLRGLTPNEIHFLSDTYHQAQASNDLNLSLSCSDQVAIAAHEAKIIADHGLLGKAAVGFLRLID